jgi:hypothetical protein
LRAADDERDAYMHCFMLNRGVLITPFHNMALISPATTEADVERHTQIFAEAVHDLLANPTARFPHCAFGSVAARLSAQWPSSGFPSSAVMPDHAYPQESPRNAAESTDAMDERTRVCTAAIEGVA